MPEAGTVVVFSGGGTGGHLYPALALADALMNQRPDVRPVFVGASRGLEARILPQRGVEHFLLPVEGFHRGGWRQNRAILSHLLRSLAQVAGAFRALRPDLTVVTGGYAGGPAGLMAVAMGIPLALQEQNAVPGVTTRVLSLAAREIHLAFPEARDRLPTPARGRARVSGNPVRPPLEISRGEARRALGLPEAGRMLLVTGGSQGSTALNRLVLEIVEGVVSGALGLPSDTVVLWSTGAGHLDSVDARLADLGNPDWLHAVSYLEEMPLALAAADLALSRAGAMATSEFLAWGIPSVLVPLPTAAEDHQRLNAEALEADGAAVNLPEAELTGAELWLRVEGLLSDPDRLEQMGRAARQRGRPNAAAEIAASLSRLLPRAGTAAA